MATLIVDGIVLVLRALKSQTQAYPVGEDPPVPKKRGRPPGVKNKDKSEGSSTQDRGSAPVALPKATAKAKSAAIPGVPMVTPDHGTRSRQGAIRPTKFEEGVDNPYSIDPTTGEPYWKRCKGCRGKQHWSDSSHDRGPHCKYQKHEASLFD